MSGLQLGRLGRRLLAQQLERPGTLASLHQFSSSAEAAASSGAGSGAGAGEGTSSSGGHRGSGGGSSGPGGQGGPWRGGQGGQQRPQRQRGADVGGGSGTARQPGAMSQLLQQQERRGPPRPPRRNAPEGGGGNNLEDTSLDFSQLPQEHRGLSQQSPSEFLTQFQYTLKMAAGKGPTGEPELVDFRDVATDIADLANMDQLPLLKYYMTPQQWADFVSGRMGEEEQNELMDRLAAAMLADDTSRAKEESVVAAMEADPDYDLEASLSSAPRLRGTPRPPAPKPAQLAAELEAQKEDIMHDLELTEEEFEAAKQATVRQMAAAGQAAAAPVLHDYLKLERRLGALLERGLPRDHPQYQAAAKRLAVLQGNPGWTHERKMVFAKRLIKRMASA